MKKKEEKKRHRQSKFIVANLHKDGASNNGRTLNHVDDQPLFSPMYTTMVLKA